MQTSCPSLAKAAQRHLSYGSVVKKGSTIITRIRLFYRSSDPDFYLMAPAPIADSIFISAWALSPLRFFVARPDASVQVSILAPNFPASVHIETPPMARYPANRKSGR